MTPREEHFSTSSLEGVQLHALHWGDPEREKVVLLHGGGANAHWWDHVAPVIAEQLHVIALDHACRHSDVRGLVAVDVARGASKRSRRTARLALVLKRSYATREEAIARYRFLPASAHATEALRVHIATHSVREEPDGRFGFKFDPRWFGLPPRPLPDLGQIRCPVLILRGSESPMLTSEGARTLVSELPDVHRVVIEGAGHHVHLDQPEAFLEAAVPFLAGVG